MNTEISKQPTIKDGENKFRIDTSATPSPPLTIGHQLSTHIITLIGGTRHSHYPLCIGIRRRFLTVTRSSKHNFNLFFIKKIFI
jgi:hypothetical protein